MCTLPISLCQTAILSSLSPGDITWRKMVWHYYTNISLITLRASTKFSPETNSKANIFKTTLFFSLRPLCLLPLQFLKLAHTQFWRVLAFNSGLLPWTFFFLPVVHCFVNPLLTTKIFVNLHAMKNAHESKNGLKKHCLMSFSIFKERSPCRPDEFNEKLV